MGHGTLEADAFERLLRDAAVEQLVDIRSFPGSRRNPQFGRDVLAKSIPAAGIGYRWQRELGGRRRVMSDSRHVALRNDAFRAYADHMESTDFLDGVDELIERSRAAPTIVMCSESVWWRCHRRLLADHLTLVRECEVEHLMHDGRLTVHPPTEGVRAVDGALVYDVVSG